MAKNKDFNGRQSLVICLIDGIQIFSITQAYLYASLMADYDSSARETSTFMFFVWKINWTSSHVIVVTEKHQTNDYPEMWPTFTEAELKDITVF